MTASPPRSSRPGTAGRPPVRAAEWLGLAALVACVLPGLYVLGADIAAPGYFTLLWLHVVAGLVSAALFVPVVVVHIARNPDGRALGALGAAGLSAAVATAIVRASDHIDDVGGAETAIVLQLAAAVTGVVLLGALAVITNRSARRGGAISGALLVAVLAGALGSGVLAWALRGDSRFPLQHAHSLLGILGTLLLAPHLRWVRRWAIGDAVRGRVVAALTLLAGVGLWGVAEVVQSVLPASEANLHRGGALVDMPMTTAQRAHPERPVIDEALLLGSQGCGVSGCHPDITHQWEGSAHRFAADNALYRAVIGGLVAERGVDEAAFCAACHDPVRVLAGTVRRDYADGAPPPGEGVNCVVCHSSVALLPGEGNGGYRYRVPIVYPGDSVEERNRNIHLDPRAHRASFLVDEHSTGGSSCEACHVVVLSPDMGAALVARVQDAVHKDEDRVADCNHCHMPTTTAPAGPPVLGMQSPPLYDHDMVGMNQDLPAYATHPDADAEALTEVARRARAFVAGAVRGADTMWEPDDAVWESDYGRALAQALSGGAVLAMEAEARRDGATLHVMVKSTNHRAGHPFPIGPFDLQEVWLEVIVRDADGPVAHRGALDADGEIDPAASRLGGVELQRDGQHLRMHRIWDVASVTDLRQVPEGGSVRDVLELALDREPRGPLVIEAGWNVRRMNPRFAREAFGEDGLRLPVHRVATVTTQLDPR